MKLNLALSQIKRILKDVKLTQEVLADNSIIQYDGEEGIQTGQPVYLADGAQDWSVLPDGDYLTKDQVKFTVTEGLVSEVNAKGEVKTAVSGPVKQAQSKTDDSLDNDNPGQNNGTPKVTKKESTKGKGAIDLSGSGDTEAHQINEPGAGAPESLLDPALINNDDSYSVCMRALNELHAQHNTLEETHRALRGAHDGLNAAHNTLVGRFDEMDKKITKMASELKKANDDKELMSRQIAAISNTPSAGAIEEIKMSDMKPVDPDMKDSKAYKILNSK